MDIANFERISLQDYPGKISTICFMDGCNLRCPYCHNPNLVLPEINIEKPKDITDTFIEYLNKRKNMLDGVVISGGEPLLQNNLINLIYKIKDIGLSVKLDTNGMFPDRLEPLITENLLDYVALDYKGSKDGLNKAIGLNLNNKGNNLYNKWIKSLKIVQDSFIDYELRTTVVREIHSKDHLLDMAKEIKEIFRKSQVPKWYLQAFEEKTDVLNNFINKWISLSAYSKEEMIQIKDYIEQIIPEVKLRNAF